MKKLRVVAASLLIVSGSAISAGPEDVTWCLTGNADSRIDQQPMKDYCPWVLAGAAVGIWYAPEYASYIVGKTQNQWSNDAARFLACSGDPSAQAAAIGLIAACQCHNAGAADWVIANGTTVLSMLRQHAGC